jgi:very-short-patch-repair endonuclease
VLSRDTPYERRFVEEVLARVANLDWAAVQAQTPFRDADGVERYIDFTISEGSLVRIAIEVDGYDKTGDGRGMSPREFADWSRREQAIASAGYRVIRVANSLVDSEPERCARTVELVLKRERALQALLAAMPPSTRPSTDDARRRFATELLAAGERDELRRLAESLAEAISELKQRLHAEKTRREDAERALDDAREHSRGVLSLAHYLVFALALAIVVVGIVVVRGTGDSASPPPAAAACRNARDWSTAGDLVGERVTLSGPVVAATYRQASTGSPTFIDVGRRHPDPERLRVVIWEEARGAFPEPPEQAYAGKTIAVSGEVTSHGGVAQVKGVSVADIVTC